MSLNLKPGAVIPVTNDSVQELLNEVLIRNEKIEFLKEQIDNLKAENHELIEDLGNEQDYNVLLWNVIAQLKGFKTE